jgi:hypothetical protein
MLNIGSMGGKRVPFFTIELVQYLSRAFRNVILRA